MIQTDQLIYTVSLRWKKAEYLAARNLDNEIKDATLVHGIFPPLKSRDVEKKRPLTPEEVIQVQVGRISECWGKRPFLLDARFLTLGEGRLEDAKRFAQLLEMSTRFHCGIIPVVDLEMNSFRQQVVRDHWLSSGNGVCVRITLGDLINSRLNTMLQELLVKKLTIKASQTLLILDLTDADISDIKTFPPFVLNWLWQLRSIGDWKRIIVETTNFPKKNPAKNNSVEYVARQEWLNWIEIFRMDNTIRDFAMFGDFGADNAKFDFGPGGIPIEHFRYARPADWMIARAGLAENRAKNIQWAANKIVNSTSFAGSNFSAGDEFIEECALDHGRKGTPTDWRQANMIHHITRVAVDLNELYSIPLTRPVRVKRGIQESLFEEK